MGAPRILVKAYNAIIGAEENIRSAENSLKTISINDYAIHAGLMFSHTDKHSVLSGANLDLVVLPSSGSDLHMLPFQYNSSEGQCDLFVYEGTYFDANSSGTEVTSGFANHDRNSLNVRNFTTFESPYVDTNSLGVEIDYALIEQTTGGAVKVAGGSAGGTAGELILNTSKNYLVRLVNNSTNTSTVKSGITLYRQG